MVPDDSQFCNKCGLQIVPPESLVQPPRTKSVTGKQAGIVLAAMIAIVMILILWNLSLSPSPSVSANGQAALNMARSSVQPTMDLLRMDPDFGRSQWFVGNYGVSAVIPVMQGVNSENLKPS